MTAMTTMIKTETKIFVREPMAMFWGLVFPSLLLLVLGLAFPGAQEPSADLGGVRLVDLYAPIVVGLGLITLGVSTLPTILATYRERGILRRLATTPAHPAAMVGSQLAVHAVVAVVSTALALAVGWLVFDIDLPGHVTGFLATFVLATAGLFTVGLSIGAVARTASAGQGMGMAVYFPLLFFAGVYFPIQVMPDTLRTISELTPSGAAVQALAATWAGSSPSFSNLAVMAAYAVVFGLASVLWFRWE